MGRSVHRVAFLDMLLATSLALEGKEIRQPAKSRRSANELHRPGAGNATRRLRRGLVGAFVIHDTVSNNGLQTGPAGDMRCQHYRCVAGSLIFGNLRRGASPPIATVRTDASRRREHDQETSNIRWNSPRLRG